MFTSLESFSVFFFVSLAFILLGIIFEEKLVELEDKMSRKSAMRKKAKKHTKIQSTKIHHNTACAVKSGYYRDSFCSEKMKKGA